MQEIISYLKEEYNRVLYDSKMISNELQSIDRELEKIAEQEKCIGIREDNPEYFFQVQCYEKIFDEEALISINQRRTELDSRKCELLIKAKDIDGVVNRLRTLYERASAFQNMSVDSGNHDISGRSKLEFILQLMDSDIQRAKLELSSFLKEEL